MVLIIETVNSRLSEKLSNLQLALFWSTLKFTKEDQIQSKTEIVCLAFFF